MFSLVVFKRRRWLRSRKIAEKYVNHARTLMPSQEPADVLAAISLLDAALKLFPQWEKALELKARALLSVRRFRDVANMLHEYIPSAKSQCEKASPPESPLFGKDKVQLLSNFVDERSKKKSLLKYLAVNKIKKMLVTGLSRRYERNEWRFVVLGQACCHLGMMEDAMILLQNGKKAACAAFRRESISLGEDSFCSDAFAGPESDYVSHLLGNIKFLIRRRAAALAAMEAGLYPEAVRHFSKILDGRRGTPQGFIAECYLYRALAHKANGKIPDAIADCNRTLCLDPTCVQALSVRASLYEMIRCFYESLQDLKQLKGLYDALAQQQRLLPRSAWRFPQNSDYTDVPGSLLQLESKISAVKQRLENRYTIDYYTILGLTNGCTKAEVERAHLLICLKHRPDKASHFIDRCEFVDDRDPESVKEEARLAATRLFRLIQNAHSGVMHVILEEDGQKRRRAFLCAEAARKDSDRPETTAREEGKDSSDKSDPNGSFQFKPLAESDDEQQQKRLAPATPLWVPSRPNARGDFQSDGGLNLRDSSHPSSSNFESRENENEQQLLAVPSQHFLETARSPLLATVPSDCSSDSQTSSSTDVTSAGADAGASHVVANESKNVISKSDVDGSPPTSYREVVAVETKLAIVLSPGNWFESSGESSWKFESHHTAAPFPVPVT